MAEMTNALDEAAEVAGKAAKRWPDPITVPSDDCELDFGGETYRPHAGQSVTVRPGLTVGAVRLLNQLAQLEPRLTAMDDDSTQAEKASVLTDLATVIDQMAGLVAPRIVEWTWTDEDGTGLPVPSKEPGVLDRLELKELMYLVLVMRGETEADNTKG